MFEGRATHYFNEWFYLPITMCYLKYKDNFLLGEKKQKYQCSKCNNDFNKSVDEGDSYQGHISRRRGMQESFFIKQKPIEMIHYTIIYWTYLFSYCMALKSASRYDNMLKIITILKHRLIFRITC